MVERGIAWFAHKDRARDFLADQLRDGSLALMLGAGFSAPLGIPSMAGLLAGCAASLGIKALPKDDNLAATSIVNACKDKAMDLSLVLSEILYADWKGRPEVLVTSARLSAFAALVMGSSRGSVSTVVTFNYDSVLEEYLQLFGYKSSVFTSAPGLVGAEDVSVYHPHGYIPSSTGPGEMTPETDLIFSVASMNKRIGDGGHPFNLALKSVIATKTILAWGLSPGAGVSTALGPLFSSQAGLRSSPLGFWLMKAPAGSNGVGFDQARATSLAEESTLLSQGIAPIVFDTYEEIDSFVFSICQLAAT